MKFGPNTGRQLVIFAGGFASGKGTCGKHLADYHGFKHVSYGDVLRVEADRQGRDKGRATLLDIAASIRRRDGLTGMAKIAVTQWQAETERFPGGLAVDGPRGIGDAEGLIEEGGQLIWIEAPIELRYKWMVDRARDPEAVDPLEVFMENERREFEGDGTPEGPNLGLIKARAMHTINNAGNKAMLFSNLDEYLGLFDSIEP